LTGLYVRQLLRRYLGNYDPNAEEDEVKGMEGEDV
jgi:hypothetical protein